jgi:hypothetical protein
MAVEITHNIMHMVLIAGRKQKDKLLKALSETGGHFINIYYGRGSVKASYLMDTLGLVQEQHKVLITCLCSLKEADAIFDMLKTDFCFDKPNTGIAYAIPVEVLSY